MGRLKRAIEVVLAVGGPASIARALHRGHALILAYHNIVPDGQEPAADRSLHLPRARFTEQLALLSRTHDIVPLEQIIDAVPRRRRARPLAAITFDDAYLGAVTAGVEELDHLRLPGTIFVAPAFVGGRSFWWDACSPAAPERDAFRMHALTGLRGDDAAVREWARQHTCPMPAVPPHARCATLGELRRAVGGGRVTLGAHSWSHRNLSLLGAGELRAEMERPLAWLHEHFPPGAIVPCFAYPYGIATPEVEAACLAAGYRAGLRVEGGPARLPLPALHRTPRLNIPAGLSPRGLELRLAGLL